MHYADDSIIAYVQIDLNTEPVSPVQHLPQWCSWLQASWP